MQLKLEQPKLPVRLEDSNAVEVTEKKEVKEVASTAQVILFNSWKIQHSYFIQQLKNSALFIEKVHLCFLDNIMNCERNVAS